jgi:DNA invertase Pin-like site-specific DNA recombinase
MVIYARISDDREGRQNGVDRQERQCRSLAERNGDTVVAVFVDDDRSAYRGKPRPGYIKMLAHLRAGLAEGVYALAPTRLYRRLTDGLEFFELIKERDLSVETVKQGRFNLATADGKRDAHQAALNAEYESDLISERTRDTKVDQVARGEYRGGPRPFGYENGGLIVRSLLCPQCGSRDGFTVDRACRACGAAAVNEPGSEALHVELATDAIVAGGSLRAECARLLAAGMFSAERRYQQEDGSRGEPERKPFRPQALRGVLLRARNAGLIEHEGEVVGRGQWPPIVPEETWRACREILLNPQRRKAMSTARVWLGSNLYRCWCGQPAGAGTSGQGRTQPDGVRRPKIPAYRCKAVEAHISRQAEALDRYVSDLAVERLSRSDAVDLLLPPPRVEPVEDLTATANALRAKLDSIAEDYAADLVTRAQMITMTTQTRERLEQVEARSAARAEVSVLASLPLGTPEIAKQWEGWHLDKRRAIIDALMTVTIHKSRRGRPKGFKPGSDQGYFDPDTIDVEWKSPG